MDRRNFVRGVGMLTVAGTLAGCSNDSDSSGGDGGDGGNETSENDQNGSKMVAAPSDVSDFLSDADNFDGKMANETGEDSVQIKVGVGENGYAFDPAAVKVSKGTKITWVWTGKGGSHNVDAQSGADFKSDLQSSAGSKFSYTADSTGTITYWCQPHHTLGMKGAIVVE